jgi:hypothetical protein
VAALHPLGIRDSPARTLAAALLLAFLLHLPLTPFPFILRWLAVYFDRGDTSWDYQDNSVIIPISLVDEPPPKSAPPSETTPAPASTESKPAGRPHPEERSRDAGVADAGEPDAGRTNVVADAGRRRKTDDEAGVALALLDAGEDGEAGAGPSVKDTMSLVGGLKRVVKGKPNISLVFWFSTMREHPLGPLVGSLLACNPQWRDFLGDQVDPLQDLDGVMLTGPRMSETSKLTLLVQSRMEDAKVQRIMGVLAEKPGGSFVDAGAGARAVLFHADRADRIAFSHPRNMIIVTPPEGFEQLRDVREPLSLPPGRGQAMSLTMVTPWRPLRAWGVKLPETLSEIRVNAFAATDGGVNLQIELDDQDAASAEAHARDVTDQARAVGGPLLGDIEFVAQGSHLSASTHFSRITSAIVLGFIRERICPSPAFDGGRGPN